jgi:GST-like protein
MIDLYSWSPPNGQKIHIMLEYPNFSRWLEALKARPALRRGIDLLAERSNRLFDGLRPETLDNMFGETQFRRR